jgi:hypothetical protein
MLVPFRFERRLSVTVDVRQMIDKNGLDVRQQRINYLHATRRKSHEPICRLSALIHKNAGKSLSKMLMFYRSSLESS